MKESVDAVITWVDGNDKAHQSKLEQYLLQNSFETRPVAAAPTRFYQCGEIDYCVKSILYFAPWIRRIFIVTDRQIPPIIAALKGSPYEHKVQVVDHHELFAGLEEYLPTFNSLAIETVLWRINGLSNNFIYFNDDCVLVRPVRYEDFFRGQRVVLRGAWKTRLLKRLGYFLRNSLRPAHRKGSLDPHCEMQRHSAELVGWRRKYYELPHQPFPLKRTTFEAYFSKNPKALALNVGYPLRDPKQFWAISLAQHIQINQRNAVIDNRLKEVIINGSYHSAEKIKNRRLARVDKHSNVAFLCIQSLDAASKSTQKLIFEWLDRKIVLPFNR